MAWENLLYRGPPGVQVHQWFQLPRLLRLDPQLVSYPLVSSHNLWFTNLVLFFLLWRKVKICLHLPVQVASEQFMEFLLVTCARGEADPNSWCWWWQGLSLPFSHLVCRWTWTLLESMVVGYQQSDCITARFSILFRRHFKLHGFLQVRTRYGRRKEIDCL